MKVKTLQVFYLGSKLLPKTDCLELTKEEVECIIKYQDEKDLVLIEVLEEKPKRTRKKKTEE